MPWVEVLTGLDVARVEGGLASVAGLKVDYLSAGIGRPETLDDVVRAVLLAEDIDELVRRGAPRNKLVAKLRDQAQFEATWAEIRCMSLLAQDRSDSVVGIELEKDKAMGAHPDLRLLLRQGPPHTSIEVKAVGMSDREVAFCRRMAPSLHGIIPPLGFVGIHAPIDGEPPKAPFAERTRWHVEAAERARIFPHYPLGLSGACVVARGTEEHYVRRAAARVEEAIKQLPAKDYCWVGLYWTSGAPVRHVATALDWSRIPEHVLGVVFSGCVLAFPHPNIDCFNIPVPRGAVRSALLVDSQYNATIASLVLDRAEESAGVRAA